MICLKLIHPTDTKISWDSVIGHSWIGDAILSLLDSLSFIKAELSYIVSFIEPKLSLFMPIDSICVITDEHANYYSV